MKTIEDYVNEIKVYSDANWARMGYNMDKAPTYSFTTGKKYHKVLVKSFGSTSVHCFVDMDGNIYKAAGYNTPAKGIRGNINNDKKPMLCGEYYK